jgi:hypothetical protein
VCDLDEVGELLRLGMLKSSSVFLRIFQALYSGMIVDYIPMNRTDGFLCISTISVVNVGE